MKGIENYDPKGLEALRAAVVQQACYDYLYFLRHPYNKLEIGTDKRRKMRYETKASLERFFRSKNFTKKWCSVSGQKIMDQLQSNNQKGFRFFSEERIEKTQKGA